MPRIDLIQAHVLRDIPTYLAILRELKQEGRVRYIGGTAAFPNQHAALESVMRNEQIDFISIDYAVDNGNVEQTIPPLAQERQGAGPVFEFQLDSQGGVTGVILEQGSQ